MNEESDFLFNDDEYDKTVYRFENMLKNKKLIYFDVSEFEAIIEYYLELNLQDKAYDAVNIAIQQHPGSIHILAKKALIFLEKSQPIEALQIIREIEGIEKNNYEIYLYKGHAYTLLGEVKKAERSFNHAIELNIEDPEDLLFNIALLFEQINHYKYAVKYLMKAYQINPVNISVLHELAFCHEKTGEMEKSIKFYEEYLEEEPFAESIWYTLGIMYTKKNDLHKAIEAYNFAIAIDPEFSAAMFNKANALGNLEKYEEAISDYQEYLSLDEDNPQAHCYIGECYEKLNQYEKAAGYYLKALELEPDFAEAWFGLGMVEIYQKNYTDSYEYVKKALELDSENSEYWFTFGRINLALRLEDNAKDSFQKAIEYDPEDEESWLAFSEFYYHHKNYNRAIAVLEEGYEHCSQSPEMNFRLGAYYLMLNKADLAEKYIKEGLKQDPESKFEVLKWTHQDKIPKNIMQLLNIN